MYMCIRRHIKRAFLQTHKWLNGDTMENTELVPLGFGHVESEIEGKISKVISEQVFPEDFLYPRTCLECAREKVCLYRFSDIRFCDFCKCRVVCQYTKRLI